MFEDVRNLWRQYRHKHAQFWAAGDPRHDLSAEVRDRLTQLDIVLEFLNAALKVFSADLAELRRNFERISDATTKLDSGEITLEQYVTDFIRPESPTQLRSSARATDEICLFTESFYFVAWRLKEALTERGGLGFHGFANFNPRGVNFVRNHLLEHAENYGRNFRRRVVITDDGPALKASAIVVNTSTGKTEPDSESIDRGLFVNAQEFHDELVQRLRNELASSP